eukprot:CFRG7605T1
MSDTTVTSTSTATPVTAPSKHSAIPEVTKSVTLDTSRSDQGDEPSAKRLKIDNGEKVFVTEAKTDAIQGNNEGRRNKRGGRGGGRGRAKGKNYSQFSRDKHGARNRENEDGAKVKRERRDHRGDNTQTRVSTKVLAEGEVAVPRPPKRKIALLLSYCGTGYYGMQINEGVPTIEEELRVAFSKAGVISEDNSGDLKKVGFQRTARTDRGVHAGGQVISFKAIVVPDLVNEVNKHLPEQFRIWSYTRVTNGFSAKNACSGRMYDYLIPTYVLAPGKEIESPNYRIDEAVLERTKAIFQLYVGTHNYHNYTTRKEATDPSAKRFIMSWNVSEPFMNDGLEVLRLSVKGQSFMLHQIRKMVGMATVVIKGTGIDKDIIRKSFLKQKISVPTAPALGLMLDTCYFDYYNEKIAESGMEEQKSLDFTATESKRDEFKKQYIYPKMVAEEKSSDEFKTWWNSIDAELMNRLEEYSAAPDAEWRPLNRLPKEPVDVNDGDDDDDFSNAPITNATQTKAPTVASAPTPTSKPVTAPILNTEVVEEEKIVVAENEVPTASS